MLSRRLPTQLCSSSSRSFSASASAHRGVTSNVGKRPIPIPDTVTLTPSPTSLTVTGPRGTTSVPLESYMALTNPEPSVLTIAVQDSTVKKQRQMWGLTRTLISNAVTGMTENFTTPVNLVGVGYRAALEADPRAVEEGHQGSGQRLNMKLGYSHSVFVPIPAHIKAEVPSATQIILSCNDKHQLGLFAAKVREWRKPEPYKGKVSSFHGSTHLPSSELMFMTCRVSSWAMSRFVSSR
jgi:large subunit ribosomal protein L6